MFPACQSENDFGVWIGRVRFIRFGNDLNNEAKHLHIVMEDTEFATLKDGARVTVISRKFVVYSRQLTMQPGVLQMIMFRVCKSLQCGTVLVSLTDAKSLVYYARLSQRVSHYAEDQHCSQRH